MGHRGVGEALGDDRPVEDSDVEQIEMTRAATERDHARGGAGAAGRHPDEKRIGAARDAVAPLPAIPTGRPHGDNVVGQPAQRRENVAASEIEVAVDERLAVAVIDSDIAVVVDETVRIRIRAAGPVGELAYDESGGRELSITGDERKCNLFG